MFYLTIIHVFQFCFEDSEFFRSEDLFLLAEFPCFERRSFACWLEIGFGFGWAWPYASYNGFWWGGIWPLSLRWLSSVWWDRGLKGLCRPVGPNTEFWVLYVHDSTLSSQSRLVPLYCSFCTLFSICHNTCSKTHGCVLIFSTPLRQVLAGVLFALPTLIAASGAVPIGQPCPFSFTLRSPAQNSIW